MVGAVLHDEKGAVPDGVRQTMLKVEPGPTQHQGRIDPYLFWGGLRYIAF
jgi:hypothetical protein